MLFELFSAEPFAYYPVIRKENVFKVWFFPIYSSEMYVPCYNLTTEHFWFYEFVAWAVSLNLFGIFLVLMYLKVGLVKILI